MNSEICLSDKNQNGVTLIELIIVISLMAVLAALAIPSFMKADTHFQRQNVSRQLKMYLERARFDSIKRNAFSVDEKSKVIIYDSTSYALVLDSNQNGKIESGEVSKISISANDVIKIADDKLIFPVTVTFNNRGQARAINGVNALVRPEFVICEKPCSTVTADAKNSDLLSISPSGNVAFVKSGEVYFDPIAPSITTINPGSKIDLMAQVSK